MSSYFEKNVQASDIEYFFGYIIVGVGHAWFLSSCIQPSEVALPANCGKLVSIDC